MQDSCDAGPLQGNFGRNSQIPSRLPHACMHAAIHTYLGHKAARPGGGHKNIFRFEIGMDDALRVQIREAQHNLPQNIEGVPPLLLRLVAKHLCKRGIAVKGKQGAGSKQSTLMDKYSKIITISTVPIIIRTHCHIAVGSVMQPVPP